MPEGLASIIRLSSFTIKKSVVCEFLLKRSLDYYMEQAAEGTSGVKKDEEDISSPSLILP